MRKTRDRPTCELICGECGHWWASHQWHPAHFATFPEKLVEPCILAGCSAGGVVLDPFLGSGVAAKHGCEGIGIEVNAEYLELAKKRIRRETEQLKMPLEERGKLDGACSPAVRSA